VSGRKVACRAITTIPTARVDTGRAARAGGAFEQLIDESWACCVTRNQEASFVAAG